MKKGARSRGEGRGAAAEPPPPATDVCVVGAGPAGLTLAHALGASGCDVLLLESGGFATDRAAQALNEGDVRGAPYPGLARSRHRRVGGTANIWDVEVEHQRAAKYLPLDPYDLDGWPLGWEALEPFYRDAQLLCGLGPFAYDAEAWSRPGRRPFDLAGTGLRSAVYHFGVADRFPGRLIEDIRTLESVRLAIGATVTALRPARSGARVAGVRGVTASGDPFDVDARVVVLACGAVECARLLLLARRDGTLPPPPDAHTSAADADWLGRGFMEHGRDFSLSLLPSDRSLFDGAAFYDLHPVAEGTHVGGRLSITEEAIRAEGLPNASITLVPRPDPDTGPGWIDRLVRAGATALGDRRRGRYGWSRVTAPSRRFDLFRLVVNLEQRPDRRNRIELSGRADRLGTPLPRLLLAWTSEEQARLERLRARLEAWFADAGLGRLRTHPGQPADLGAHHHAGTTRMARTPEAGVTDPDGRVFGVRDLYVTGASLFPTAGFANPTLTVVALALRLARHLAGSEAGG